MGDRIESDMGDDVDSAIIGKKNRQRVNRYDGHQTVNVDLHHMPTTETERRQWMVDQLLALRNALIGDSRFGVKGLVDDVRYLRLWLIVVGAMVVALLLMMAWQQFQINEIIQQLSEMAR